MYKTVLLWFCICISCGFAHAQSQQEFLFQARLSNFNKQIQILPQEKIYIQTDKSYYITGEKLFFRAHLVDAMYHMPVSASAYVYVELINPLQEVVLRLKLRPEEGIYSGQFDLPEDLPDGAYKIRSYTHFMRNLDETCFFSKVIYIADPNSNKLETTSEFQFEGNKVFMTLKMEDKNLDRPEIPEEILLSVNNGVSKKVKLNSGSYKLTFTLEPENKERIVFLQTSYRGYSYKKYIHIPYPENKYHVSFFPEGGNLLHGVTCAVAFKAVKSDGLSENISGEIFDSKNNLITDFRSGYLGMGLLNLNLDANEDYYAVCKNDNGVVFRTNLPKTQKNSCALETNSINGQLYIGVNRTQEMQHEELYLIVHSRGQLLYASAWNKTDSHILFDTKELSSGVHHFILLNSSLKPVSERLVFVNNPDQATLHLEADKTTYEPRERVSITVNLSVGKIPVTGNFSVSVTDDAEVRIDSATNILVNLLLTSELRGNIENPAAYFNESDRKAAFKLDMLMMTQGWRRYDIAEALSGKFTHPVFEVEQGQKIKGKVQSGLLLTPTEKAQVSVISRNNDFTAITETDKEGRFIFDKFELPDSTSVLVQAISKKGSDRMVLTIDNDTFPVVTAWEYPRMIVDEDMLHKYVHKEELKYNYEKGMRLINLDDIVVTAQRKEETRSAYTSYADQSLTADDIGSAAGLTIRKLLDRLGSVDVAGDGTVSIRGKNPVLLLVNDVETDLEYLDDIDAYDVLRIDVLQSTTAFGMKSTNGVISISTKSLEGISPKKQFNMQNITPLGYHKPVEFYAPVYDTQESKENGIPDLRTTIFWSPAVRTNDTGHAMFDFYTSDNAGSYTIIIEGLSDTGQIIFHKSKL